MNLSHKNLHCMMVRGYVIIYSNALYLSKCCPTRIRKKANGLLKIITVKIEIVRGIFKYTKYWRYQFDYIYWKGREEANYFQSWISRSVIEFQEQPALQQLLIFSVLVLYCARYWGSVEVVEEDNDTHPVSISVLFLSFSLASTASF